MLGRVTRIPCLAKGLAEQQAVLRDFHAACSRLLSGVMEVAAPTRNAFDPERNFFSALFLASLAAVGMDAGKRRLFGFVNQCLRATVTGCDNLLDEDRREVFRFRLPGRGYRFKSVLTIMTADRLLSERATAEAIAGRLTFEQAHELQRLSLTTLVASGAEEHAEEAGILDALSPAEVLRTVHAVKTGLLFEAPLLIPEAMGLIGGPATRLARRGLHEFGVGCQILDDMADVELDLRQRRHNYVLSLAVHRSRCVLKRLRAAEPGSDDVAESLTPHVRRASAAAQKLMHRGLARLARGGLKISAADQRAVCDAMFPLLLTKDIRPA